ncbi:MAG: tetratricopeptide repeat protein [Asticcacaulis sp.]
MPQNYTTAEQWYEKAANKGFVGGMTAVAHLYEQGLGVTQNYPLAHAVVPKAAALGDSDSMAMLGNMYYNGEGTAPDASLGTAVVRTGRRARQCRLDVGHRHDVPAGPRRRPGHWQGEILVPNGRGQGRRVVDRPAQDHAELGSPLRIGHKVPHT